MKNGSDEYRQSIEMCRFIRLKEKHTIENKYLCKAVKPLLSNKLQSSEKIKFLKENDFLITNEDEVAMELNDSFSNAVILY